ETPSPLLVGGRLFLVSNRGIASAVDVKTEKRLWLERLGGNFAASPITDRRHIYFFGCDGRTHVVSMQKDPEVVAVNDVGGKLWACPAVSGRAMFLRTDTALYRIEER